MITRRSFNLLYCLFLILCAPASADTDRAALSPQIFNHAFSPEQDDRNVLESYIIYRLKIYREKDPGGIFLTADNFPEQTLWNREISVKDVRKASDGVISLVASVDGRLYRANIDLNNAETVITITAIQVHGGSGTVRFFPAASDYDIPDDIFLLAENVTLAKEFTLGPEEEEKLYKAFARLLYDSYESGIFSEIGDAEVFFKSLAQTLFTDISIMAWTSADYENLIHRFVTGIMSEKPHIRKKLAMLLNAIGRTFYEHRIRSERKRSAFFYSLAHELEPDNELYHSNWAWVLSKIPGRMDEGLAQNEFLLSKNPENKRLMTDRIYLHLKQVEQSVSALEKESDKLTAGEILKRSTEINAEISNIIVTVRKSLLRVPRAMSGRGQAHWLAQRLHLSGLKHLGKFADTRGLAASYGIRAIYDCAEGLRCLKEACRLSGVTLLEIEHAADMRKDYGYRLLTGLDACRMIIQATEDPYVERGEEIRSALDRIITLLGDKTNDPLAARGRKTAENLKLWLTAGEDMCRLIKNAVTKCTEDDIQKPDAFFASIAGHVKREIKDRHYDFTADRLVENIVSWYKGKGAVNSPELAIIHAVWLLRNEKKPVNENAILEYTAILGEMIPEAVFPENYPLSDRIRVLSRLFDLDIKDGEMPAIEEKRASDTDSDVHKKAEAAGMLSPGDLAYSIDESRPGNFIARLKELQALYDEKLFSWQAHKSFNPGYIGKWRQDITSLANKMYGIEENGVRGYVDDVAVFLETNKKKMTKNERDGHRRTQSSLSEQHSQIISEFTYLEAIMEKRRNSIEKLIKDTCLEIGKEKNRLEYKYASFDVPWLYDQFSFLDASAAQIADLTDGSGPDHLSYDSFTALVKAAHECIDEINDFGIRVESYENILQAISLSRSELKRMEELYGHSALFDGYRAHVDTVEKEIFEFAAIKKISMNNVSEDKKLKLEGVLVRSRLIIEVNAAVSGVENVYRKTWDDEEGDAVLAEKEKLIISVRSWLYEDDLIPGDPSRNGILKILLDPAQVLPAPDDFKRIREALEEKYRLLVSGRDTLLDVVVEPALDKLDILSQRFPDILTPSEAATLNDNIQLYKKLVSEIRDISLFDHDVMDRLKSKEDRCDGVQKANEDIVTAASKKMVLSVCRQVGLMKKCWDFWLTRWIGDKVPLDKQEAISAQFDKVISVIEDRAKDDEITTKRIRSIENMVDREMDALETLLHSFVKDLDTALLSFQTPLSANELLAFYGRLQAPPYSAFTKYPGVLHLLDVTSSKRMTGTLLWDSDGKASAGEDFIYDMSETNPAIGHVIVPVMNIEGNPAVAKVNEHAVNLIRRANSFAVANVKGADICLRPQLCALIFANGINSYRRMLFCIGEPEIEVPMRMDLYYVLLKMTVDNMYEAYNEYARKVLEEDDRLSIAREKIAFLAKRETEKGELTPEEADYRIRLVHLMDAITDERLLGVYNKANVEKVRQGLGKIIYLCTGTACPDGELPAYQVPEMPRFLLTADEETGRSGGLFGYTIDERFSGVIVEVSADGCISARVEDEEVKAGAWLLCDMINKAITEYMTRLAPGFVQPEEKTEAWYSMVEEMIKRLACHGPIRIRVAKDVPMKNSMAVNDTILLDKDLIEYLRSAGSAGGARDVILGERLFHEIGLIVFMGPPEGDAFTELLRDQKGQTYRDALLNTRVFGRSPDLEKAVEKCTDEKVTDRVTGRCDKFSHIFGTTTLFKNIKRWGSLIISDPKAFEKEAEAFVKRALERWKAFLPPVPEARPDIIKDKRANKRIAPLNIFFWDALLKKCSLLDEKLRESRHTKPADFNGKKRHIVISSNLIPLCQQKLSARINELSREAFEAGRTTDLVEIKPLSYIESLKSDQGNEYVLLMDGRDIPQYKGKETYLTFTRGEEDVPLCLNGLIAAGRAVLYEEFGALNTLLRLLSGDDQGLVLPDADSLRELYKGDKETFSRSFPVIILPRIKSEINDLELMNKRLLYYCKFA